MIQHILRRWQPPASTSAFPGQPEPVAGWEEHGGVEGQLEAQGLEVNDAVRWNRCYQILDAFF